MNNDIIDNDIKKITIIDNSFNKTIIPFGELQTIFDNKDLIGIIIKYSEYTIRIFYGIPVKIDKVLKNMKDYNISFYFSNPSISINDNVLCNYKHDRLTLYTKLEEGDIIINDYNEFLREIKDRLYKNNYLKKLSERVS